MKINDWIKQYKESGGTVALFAKSLGVNTSTAYDWLNGETFPGVLTAIKIKAVTGGLVRPEDWTKEEG
jgi:hypothetical protein